MVRTVAVGFAAFVLIGAANALYGPVLPGLAQRYGLTPTAAGLMFAAHGAGAFAAVTSCILPAMEARMRYRPVLALGFMGTGSLAIAALGPWPTMLVGAFAVGAGFDLVTVGLNGLFARSFGARSVTMVNALNALFGIGAIGAPAVLVASGGSVPIAFGLLGVACLLLALLAWPLDDRSAARASIAGGPASDRPGLLPFALVALAVGLEACLVGWGPVILVAKGVDNLDAARAASSFFAVFVVVRLAATLLSTQLSPRALVLGPLIAIGAAALLADTVSNPTAMFAAMGVTGMVFPNLFAWVSRLGGGRSDALVVGTALAGGMLAPLGMGVAAGIVGAGDLFRFIAGLATVAVVLAWRADGGGRRS